MGPDSPRAADDEVIDALEACAHEPIHQPGATQGYGAALIVDASARITHVSASAERHLGVAPSSLLGADAREALGGDLRAALEHARALHFDQVANTWAEVGGRTFEVTNWRRPDGACVLALVASSASRPSGMSFEELAELQRRLAAEENLAALCDRVAASFRELSGYDRVMVYRFDGEGNGQVVSEARAGGLEPYLGKWYPASDIPAQARALYLRCRVRVLADARASQDELLAHEPTAAPADLSKCLVRSHSPIHREYLSNMGVRATLVVSILTADGRLWGLVACHHLSPHVPSLGVRLLSEVLADSIETRVQLHESRAREAAVQQVATAHHDLVRALVTAGRGWPSVVVSPHARPTLLGLIPSSGVACVDGDAVHVLGNTPPPDVLARLPKLLEGLLDDHVFQISALDPRLPELHAHAAVASGVLALRVRPEEGAWLFWFRPERRRNLTWAGDVSKAFTREDGRLRLRPRASFAAFDEEQRGRAEPWSGADLAAARRVRESLVDVLLQLYATTADRANLDRVRVLRACQAASEPLGVVDASGVVVYVNPAWEQLFGAVDARLPADTQLSSAFLGPDVHRSLVDVLEGRVRSFSCEANAVVHHASPEPLRVLVKVDSVRTEGGLCAGAVIVATDLRARLREEAERERTRMRLERAERVEALALVTGSVAHDFNNLLTGILCEATLLQEEALDPDQRGSAEQIERTARRAAELCRQLLAYSGKATVVVERVDLGALVDDMLTVLRSIVPAAVQLAARVPSRAVVVLGDPTQLRQVVMNLVVNACDATEGRSGVVEVSLDVERATGRPLEDGGAPLPSGDYAVVRVRDHGIGISEEQRPKIFEPFFSSKGVGKGLGLAGVLGIVRSHRGGVEIQSEVGKGSCFSVWLPEAPPLSVEGVLASIAPGSRGGRAYVLVVEDEEQARIAVCRILERDGYAVLSAATVSQARAILESGKPEICVVFTDFVLPDGTGADVIAAAAARDPELPVIVTSGYSHGLEPVHATPNLLGFLPKPFDRSDISKIVGDGVRKYRGLHGVTAEA